VASDCLLHRCDMALEAKLLNRVLGAQQVALGNDLLHGKRSEHLRPRRGQSRGSARESRQNQQACEPRDEEASKEKHRLFDQFSLPKLAIAAQHRMAQC
jgi:hypothetical protein